MLKNANLLPNIGADTAENEQNLAEFLPKNWQLAYPSAASLRPPRPGWRGCPPARGTSRGSAPARTKLSGPSDNSPKANVRCYYSNTNENNIWSEWNLCFIICFQKILFFRIAPQSRRAGGKNAPIWKNEKSGQGLSWRKIAKLPKIPNGVRKPEEHTG